MAASKGFAVGDVVTDLDVSGAKHPLERPGMARALEEIKAGRAGGIVAHDLFRITREPAHGAWLAEEISAADGVMLAPDLGEDIMSPVGEFAFAVYLGVGKLYRRQVGERFETVKRNAAREGIRIGAPLLGYTKDEHRRMVVDPETAPVVVELFERRARGRHPRPGELPARANRAPVFAAVGGTHPRQPRLPPGAAHLRGRGQRLRSRGDCRHGAVHGRPATSVDPRRADRQGPVAPLRPRSVWQLRAIADALAAVAPRP